MQFTSLALLAGALNALAQTTSIDLQSVISVFQTALPSSLKAQIETDAAGAFSSLSTQFAAGATPAWYSNVPPDIKSFMANGGAASALATYTSDSSTAVGTDGAVVTTTDTNSSGTISMSSSSSGSTEVTSSESTSTLTTDGTAVQTTTSTSTKAGGAVPMTVGAGLVAGVGLVGLLAL